MYLLCSNVFCIEMFVAYKHIVIKVEIKLSKKHACTKRSLLNCGGHSYKITYTHIHMNEYVNRFKLCFIIFAELVKKISLNSFLIVFATI